MLDHTHIQQDKHETPDLIQTLDWHKATQEPEPKTDGFGHWTEEETPALPHED